MPVLAGPGLEVECALWLAGPERKEALLRHNRICHCRLHLARRIKAERESTRGGSLSCHLPARLSTLLRVVGHCTRKRRRGRGSRKVLLRGKKVGGGVPSRNCRDRVEEVGDAVGTHMGFPEAGARRRWGVVRRHRCAESWGGTLWSGTHVRWVVELALIPKLAGARLHKEAAVRLARAHGGHAVRIAVVRDRGARCVLDRTVDLPTLLSDSSFAVNGVVVPAKEDGGKGRGKAKAKGNNGGRVRGGVERES